MSTLLDRVRAASGPDRELDELLLKQFDPQWHARLKRLFERTQKAFAEGLLSSDEASREYAFGDCPRFTESVDACLALCERVRPGWDWTLGHTNGGLTIHCNLGNEAEAFGETPPLAILAALIALEDNDNASTT